METHNERKIRLQHHNAVLKYHTFMESFGVTQASVRFPFLDLEKSELVLHRLAALHRQKPAKIDVDPTHIIEDIRKWLLIHSGTIYCFVPNVGAFSAENTAFIEIFDFISSLIDDNLLLSTPELDGSVMAHQFESMYYCTLW